MDEEGNLARQQAAENTEKQKLKLLQGGRINEVDIGEKTIPPQTVEEQANILKLKERLGLIKPQGQAPSAQDLRMLEAKRAHVISEEEKTATGIIIKNTKGEEIGGPFIEEQVERMTGEILEDSGEKDLATRLEKQDFKEKRQKADDRLQEMDQEVMANVQEENPTPEVLLTSDINDTLSNEDLQSIGVTSGTVGIQGQKGTTTSDKLSAIENFITAQRTAIKQREESLNAGYITQLKGFASRLFSKNKRKEDRQEERNAIHAQESLDKLMNL
ncbi:MAG: hypothetical protein COU27_01400, partial [Candidatus Levybacteria bacterium CG10_big_fil_rev_8_21_14_0_10_36_7]